MNVLLSSPTSGKYEPEEQIELNFRLEEISGKGVRNVRPQLYLKGPGGFTKKINGDSLKVGGGQSVEGSITWDIPRNVPSGSYVPSLYIYSEESGKCLDNKWPKSWTFTVDKNVSYVEVEPTGGFLGKGRAVHVHFAKEDLSFKNEAATVTNIEDMAFGNFLRLVPSIKAVIHGSATGIPAWLETLSTTKSLVELGQSLTLNADGSMDFLFMEVAGGWGWAYMDRGLVEVGDFEIPTGITKFPFPKSIPEHFHAKLRYPTKNIADTVLEGYEFVNRSPSQVEVMALPGKTWDKRELNMKVDF
ncbi:hypothetical protein AKJ65_05690 [candidate division MSBL1 archaeon SCGC-AAA259E19]|uniref:Uncharacterized protein n=1 Tax=candidate division MSBL1 archaeon SCGC-AAA259E19 TaxID=1698264 RepID=A0A133UIM6_9EURY|nr:hypothetical protein AKJ65_05690 [candidate division MSBL1 archaeon SCGC-AAA259E19]